jgi:hypothetical protein
MPCPPQPLPEVTEDSINEEHGSKELSKDRTQDTRLNLNQEFKISTSPLKICNSPLKVCSPVKSVKSHLRSHEDSPLLKASPAKSSPKKASITL